MFSKTRVQIILTKIIEYPIVQNLGIMGVWMRAR